MKSKRKFRVSSCAYALDPKAFDFFFMSAMQPTELLPNGVAVVHIAGPLEHHAGFFDSYEAIAERLEDAFCDDDVRAVVMKIDSPGGDANGVFEANRAIRAMRAEWNKPLFAYSDESMYSAAYALGCAADEIWLPQTGGVGSVGVICSIEDRTKANEKSGRNIKLVTTGARKGDSHPDRELTDDVLASVQATVNQMGTVFFETVAECRGIEASEVQSLEAACYMGALAVNSGLADNVGSWQEFLAYVTAQLSEPASMTPKAKLTKERNALATQIEASNSPSEKKKLLALYSAKCAELSALKAKAEEPAEDGEEEVAEEEEASEEEAEEECEEDEDEPEEGDDPEAVSASVGKKLAAAVRRVTGQKNLSAALGALEAMPSIRETSRNERFDALVDAALAKQVITPGEARSFKAQKSKDPAWIKGHLSTKAKLKLRTSDDGAQDGNINAPDITLNMQGLDNDQQKLLGIAARSAGKSVADYTKELSTKAALNGARRF